MLTGFDTSVYPGRAVMVQLRKHFAFCGYYLAPAPSHRDKSWCGQRAPLVMLGYKFLPVYVGQQIIGPGSHHDTTEQGVNDARDACALMAKEGFAKGSPVYLDLENGAPFPPAEQLYAFAWIDGVRAAGFTPGVYCSHVLAPHFDPDTTRIWAFEVPTTRTTFDRLPLSSRNQPPRVVPWTAQQYRQNVRLDRLNISVDLDATPDTRGLAS